MEFVPPDFKLASPLLEKAALVPGSASDLERIYSYLHSFSLYRELIDTFNLYSHYEISHLTDEQKRSKKIQRILEQNIQVRITRNATILVQVYDRVPRMAYEITLFLLRRTENFCRQIIGMEKALAETQRQLEELLREVRRIEEELSRLRTQYKIITGGSEQSVRSPLIPTLEAFAHYDKVLSMETRLVRLQHIYTNLMEEKVRREDFIRIYPTPIFVIQPPYEPVYPDTLNPYLLIGLGLMGSCLIAMGVAYYLHFLGLLKAPQSQSREIEVIPS
ncbi:MAG: hypothetical protein NZ611_00295 [Bacteroidia bacterium]|nr:hypothetical protein [Bacteroidia bacterium]